MRRITIAMLGMLTLGLGLSIGTAHAAARQLRIDQVLADLDQAELTIRGQNFGTTPPTVTLGGNTLLVRTSNETEIKAELTPAILAAPASYGLIVAKSSKSKDRAAFEVTLGASAGQPGPLTALDGIACDSGSPDKPNGRTIATVDPATGLLTLSCHSTNPVLTLTQFPGPEVCSSFGPIHVCVFFRFTIQQVGANGTPVANGFACTVPANLSPFPSDCQTQRFAEGATVRLRPTDVSQFVPQWSGCDSVNGDTCTVVITGDRAVTVVPVAAN